MVQKQECQDFEIGIILSFETDKGSSQQVEGACCEQVVEVGEEGVFKLSVLGEGLGHFFPVAGKVFEEMTVCFEFSALESKSLEVADGQKCGDRE